MLNKNDAEHTTEDFSERLESMSNVSTDASNLERLNRWNSAVELFKERPFFGWGPGTYAFVYAPYQDASDLTIISTNFGDGGNAHSEYLGPLAESGVLGLLTFLGLIITVISVAVNSYARTSSPFVKSMIRVAFLGLITYFLHGFLNNFLDMDKASAPFWGFFALLASISVKSRAVREK